MPSTASTRPREQELRHHPPMNSSSTRRVPFVALVVALLAAGPSAALAQSTYHVAVDGSDDAPGTAAAPWATLQQAADSVAPGDTVVVHPGSYRGMHLTRSGTTEAPITFRADAGTVVDEENARTPDGINLEGASFVVVEGFEARGLQRAGLRAVNCEAVVFRNNGATDNGKWGILTGFCDDLLIEGNRCSGSVDEHGIYVSNSGDRPVVRGNQLFSNSGNGLHMNGDASAGGDGIITGALVEDNVVWDNGTRGGSGINCDGVQDSVIRNNLLYENHASGISLYRIDGGGPSSGNSVVNNTVVQADDGRWALNVQHGAVNNRVFNNVLLSRSSRRGAIDLSADSREGFAADHNVVIGRFTLDAGSSQVDLAGWQALGYGAHSLEGTIDAVFVAAGAGDYHLAADSPALDVGAADGAPPADFEGDPRPQGAGVDVGADERCEGDCGETPDGGMLGPDAGPSGAGDGGATGSDGGTGPGRDAGPVAAASDAGCGCRSGGRAGGAPSAALLLLALGMRGRRRRG